VSSSGGNIISLRGVVVPLLLLPVSLLRPLAVVVLVPGVAVLAFSERGVWAGELGGDQSNDGEDIVDTLVIEGCTHGRISSNVLIRETIR